MRRLAIALLLLCTAGAGLASSAQAATYTVGTVKDEPGTCANPASGACSLRQLINYEDQLAPPPSPLDVILLPAGTYELTEGELDITQSLVILGAGARTTKVEASEESRSRVFFTQASGEGNAIGIEGLEISGGIAEADEFNGGFGGDIRNTGSLLLSEDWITEGTASAGGGISNDTGTLVLERSLVSNNHASTGEEEEVGGGGIQNYGSANCDGSCEDPGKPALLSIEDSTVAGNDSMLGAGIFSLSENGVADENVVSIINSTVAYNKTQQEPCTECIARGPGAGILVDAGTADVVGSIVALNTETTAGGVTNTNCLAASPGTILSLGYNLENETDCGFKSSGDLQKTSPDLSSSTPRDNGGGTDTLAPEPTSPAVNAIPTGSPFCEGIDQRGITRPQGAGCDIGAVELASVASTSSVLAGSCVSSGEVPVTVSAIGGAKAVDFRVDGGAVQSAPTSEAGQATIAVPAGQHTLEYWGEDQAGAQETPHHTLVVTVASGGPGLTISSEQGKSAYVVGEAASVAIVASGPGLTSDPSAAHVALSTEAPGSFSLARSATDICGTTSASFDYTVARAKLANLPAPVLGTSVNVEPVSGEVFVKLPSTGHASLARRLDAASSLETAIESLSKGVGFIPLREARQIPVGSILDTSAGVARIATATATVGKQQLGEFGAGLFKLLQARKLKGLTELDIMNTRSARQVCASLGKGAGAGAGAGAREAKSLSSKVLGRLSGSAHGKYTTRGQYSAATVRGTVWSVANQCDGTLTKVKRGVVTVRDFRRRKTITLFTGQQYLARAAG